MPKRQAVIPACMGALNDVVRQLTKRHNVISLFKNVKERNISVSDVTW